jgi:hypothetical protein
MATTIQSRPELSPQSRLAVRLRDELESKRCICHRRKAAGKSFCSKCQMQLTKELADGLDKKIFAGYEEAYQAAVDFLAEQKRKGRHA